ncbi:MAG: D-alanine--D-alanine ligase [Patescibacteria group bacterium]
MQILVVYGGEGLTREAEVSVASGTMVIEAAKQAGFTVSAFELTKDNINELSAKVRGVDVVFPALHGHFGEDGQIQQLLDKAGVKYVGSGVAASRLCWDKLLYKEKLRSAGILTPKWWVLDNPSDIKKIVSPCVIKAIDEGSSLDMIVVREMAELDIKAVGELLQKRQRLLVEDYIEGTEISVGVLDNVALPVVEIIPPTGRWFDYQAKYSGESQELVPALSLTDDQQLQARDLSLVVHQLTGCRHLSRTDMIIQNDKIYAIETNTLPGLTKQSLYPKAAQAAGYDLPALISKLIELV